MSESFVDAVRRLRETSYILATAATLAGQHSPVAKYIIAQDWGKHLADQAPSLDRTIAAYEAAEAAYAAGVDMAGMLVNALQTARLARRLAVAGQASEGAALLSVSVDLIKDVVNEYADENPHAPEEKEEKEEDETPEQPPLPFDALLASLLGTPEAPSSEEPQGCPNCNDPECPVGPLLRAVMVATEATGATEAPEPPEAA